MGIAAGELLRNKVEYPHCGDDKGKTAKAVHEGNVTPVVMCCGSGTS